MKVKTKKFDIVARPAKAIFGKLRVPGDKSISHRAIMLGSIAEGTTKIDNFLQGQDSLATLEAFRHMGVSIERSSEQVSIEGVGLHGLQQPQEPIWLGNSGTAMRLVTGLLSAQKFSCELTGDASLSSRPMARVIQPLQAMGAKITSRDNQYAPLVIHPVDTINAIDYRLPVASAQIKSALLLAGLYATAPVHISESKPTRNHTELMLQAFGVDVQQNNGNIVLQPPQRLEAICLSVPADISSAAFFLVAAVIATKSDVVLEAVGINQTRTGIIDILRLMGAKITIENEALVGKEKVADIHIQPTKLRGIDVPEELVPLAIDEFPIIFIAAASAEGMTRITGAEELRVKESDRILAMVTGLQALGIFAQALDDGAVIKGGTITGGEVNSYHDHRIAMSFAIASLIARDTIRINNCANIDTSFPRFVELANGAGLALEVVE